METKIYFSVISLKSLPLPKLKENCLLNMEGLSEVTVTPIDTVDFDAIVPGGKFFTMDSMS